MAQSYNNNHHFLSLIILWVAWAQLGEASALRASVTLGHSHLQALVSGDFQWGLLTRLAVDADPALRFRFGLSIGMIWFSSRWALHMTWNSHYMCEFQKRNLPKIKGGSFWAIAAHLQKLQNVISATLYWWKQFTG